MSLSTRRRLGLGLVLAALGAGLPARKAFTAEPADASAFAASVETAHGKAAWRAAKALQALSLTFGDRPALAGTILFRTNLATSRIELEGGSVAVFDGFSPWVAPASSKRERASGKLSDPKFVEPAADAFARPADAREDKLPKP